MKFCPECGSKLASESAKFCSECGFKLNISNPLNVEESGEIKCNISSEKEEDNEFEYIKKLTENCELKFNNKYKNTYNQQDMLFIEYKNALVDIIIII